MVRTPPNRRLSVLAPEAEAVAVAGGQCSRPESLDVMIEKEPLETA